MGYCIDYQKPKKKGHSFLKIFLGILFLLGGFCFQYLSVTGSALPLEAFASDLREGVPLQQAVEAFCGELIHGLS